MDFEGYEEPLTNVGFLLEAPHSPLLTLEVLKSVTGTNMQVPKAALDVAQVVSF